MTPLYDIVSAQPSLAARQIRQNQMKLAMAGGDNRHTIMHTITNRHFAQTAKRCGMPETIVAQSIEELASIAQDAIDKTMAAMPPGFPAQISASITDAMLRRLALLLETSNKSR